MKIFLKFKKFKKIKIRKMKCASSLKTMLLSSIYWLTDFMAELKLKLDLFGELKCAVGGRYFVAGGKIVGCWHILTGLSCDQ